VTLRIDSSDRPLEPIAPAGKGGRWCLPASFCAHAAVLALMVGLVGEVSQLKGESEIPVDVDIITVSDMTSADSNPAIRSGESSGEEVSQVEPLEVAEPKPVEVAALDPVEEVEPLALEAADSPEATELEAADEPEAKRQEAVEAEPVPSAQVEEPKQALPVLATRSEALESAPLAEEVAGEDAETAIPTEIEAQESPALPTKVAELTPKVEPRELMPLPEKTEAEAREEKQEPAKKPAQKKKLEEKKEAKERKKIEAAKTAEKAREGKTKKKTGAVLAGGNNSEADIGKQRSLSGSASMSNYRGLIAAQLRRHKRYPEEAQRKGVRGTVRISFTISKSGHVTGSRLVASSGEPSLDREVRAMLQRASPFPPIPDDMGSSLSFTVPINFAGR